MCPLSAQLPFQSEKVRWCKRWWDEQAEDARQSRIAWFFSFLSAHLGSQNDDSWGQVDSTVSHQGRSIGYQTCHPYSPLFLQLQLTRSVDWASASQDHVNEIRCTQSSKTRHRTARFQSKSRENERCAHNLQRPKWDLTGERSKQRRGQSTPHFLFSPPTLQQLMTNIMPLSPLPFTTSSSLWLVQSIPSFLLAFISVPHVGMKRFPVFRATALFHLDGKWSASGKTDRRCHISFL